MAMKKKTMFESEDRVLVQRKDYIKGNYYIGLIGSDRYLFQMGDDKGKYIHKNVLHSMATNFGSNFSTSYLATKEEIELLELSKKNGTYTDPPKPSEYIIKLPTKNYVAATDKNGEIKWSEEILDVLKYLKDDTKISYVGSVNYKPKTLKELKELIKT